MNKIVAWFERNVVAIIGMAGIVAICVCVFFVVWGTQKEFINTRIDENFKILDYGNDSLKVHFPDSVLFFSTSPLQPVLTVDTAMNVTFFAGDQTDSGYVKMWMEGDSLKIETDVSENEILKTIYRAVKRYNSENLQLKRDEEPTNNSNSDQSILI